MEREEALKIFALSEAYTDKDLRKTYLKLSKKYHPDVNNSQDAEEMMKKINEARDVLSSFTFSNSSQSFDLKKFHKELVVKLKNKLQGVNQNDEYLKGIKQIIIEFENISLNNKCKDDISNEYVKASNKILDVFSEIKQNFLKKYNIPVQYSYHTIFFNNLGELYEWLNKINDEFKLENLKQKIINSIQEQFINRKYYKHLEKKINEICREEIKDTFDVSLLNEKVCNINNKVELLFIKYQDAIQVINKIKLVLKSIHNGNLTKTIETEILSFNFDYINNYAKIHELLIDIALQKNIDAKRYSLLKFYVFETYSDNLKLLQRMLRDIDLVFDGFLDSKIFDIIIKKEYTSLDEYNKIINNYLNKSSIIFVKKKLIISGACNIGLITRVDNAKVVMQNGKHTWEISHETLKDSFETIESFLRNNSFIGESVHNDKEILLYTNGVTALYVPFNGGTLVFKDFDKDHGNKIDHPDVNKYEDFCVMKKKIYELLNDEMERKFERRRKKYGL